MYRLHFALEEVQEPLAEVGGTSRVRDNRGLEEAVDGCEQFVGVVLLGADEGRVVLDFGLGEGFTVGLDVIFIHLTMDGEARPSVKPLQPPSSSLHGAEVGGVPRGRTGEGDRPGSERGESVQAEGEGSVVAGHQTVRRGLAGSRGHVGGYQAGQVWWTHCLDVAECNGARRTLPGQGDRNSEEDGMVVRDLQVQTL